MTSDPDSNPQNPKGNLQMIGFLVNNDRDKVKKEKPERLEEFDRLVGRKKYLPSAFYSIEDTLKYQRVATSILFGNESLESFYKMGQMDFHIINKTNFAKTALSLAWRDLKTGLMSFPRIFSSITKGFNIKSFYQGEGQVDIVFERDPYPRTYLQGLIEEGVKVNFGKECKVSTEEILGGGRKYSISWK